MVSLHTYTEMLTSAANRLICAMAKDPQSIYDLDRTDDQVMEALEAAIKEYFVVRDADEFFGFGDFLSATLSFARGIIAHTSRSEEGDDDDND